MTFSLRSLGRVTLESLILACGGEAPSACTGMIMVGEREHNTNFVNISFEINHY